MLSLMRFSKVLGFSLIELLVSISIISILMAAAFAILRPQDYFARTRDSRRISDLKVVQTTLEQYYANNNSYPPTPPAAGSFTFGSSWSAGSPLVTYSRMMPSDPSGSPQYCYKQISSGYELCAVTEKTTGVLGTASGCTNSYKYCLTNPF